MADNTTINPSTDPSVPLQTAQVPPTSGVAQVTINPDGTETVTPANQNPVLQSTPVPAANSDPEFGNLDQAIAQQQNTQGQKVVDETGAVNPNLAINPETGELYKKLPPAVSDADVNNYLQNIPPADYGPPPKMGGPSDGSPSPAGATTTSKTTSSGSNQSAASTEDWRIRISLAPKADYLYNIAEKTDILYPLKGTNGIIFPYTPTINTSYRANYDPAELTHNNYKMYFYKNSSVDDITITADFTAQDTQEANYLLAVIHFFKSVTKMFYGQDTNPRAGTPPPLVYLTGYGAYQFDNHPLAVTNFTYNLPNDVDYIRAGTTKNWGGSSVENIAGKGGKQTTAQKWRLAITGLKPGAAPKAPEFVNLATNTATYVPTKIQLTISLVPIVTRRDISKNFSLKSYATGKLLQGSKQSGGGIW